MLLLGLLPEDRISVQQQSILWYSLINSRFNRIGLLFCPQFWLQTSQGPTADITFDDTGDFCVRFCTSLTAHMRAMDPMLLVMVTSVALARSSLLMLSRFSLLIMWPKLSRKDNYYYNMRMIKHYHMRGSAAVAKWRNSVENMRTIWSRINFLIAAVCVMPQLPVTSPGLSGLNTALD